MVYESDFYTTRRPYRTTPSYSTYTTSKREIPWEKVPFVPRPSLVADPVTAFGRRDPHVEEAKRRARGGVLSPEGRAKIRPALLPDPPKEYKSPRDLNRDRILASVRRNDVFSSAASMDVLLPRLHRVAECPDLPYKRQIVAGSDMPPIFR